MHGGFYQPAMVGAGKKEQWQWELRAHTLFPCNLEVASARRTVIRADVSVNTCLRMVGVCSVGVDEVTD